jgi:hypothetical protein
MNCRMRTSIMLAVHAIKCCPGFTFSELKRFIEAHVANWEDAGGSDLLTSMSMCLNGGFILLEPGDRICITDFGRVIFELFPVLIYSKLITDEQKACFELMNMCVNTF